MECKWNKHSCSDWKWGTQNLFLKKGKKECRIKTITLTIEVNNIKKEKDKKERRKISVMHKPKVQYRIDGDILQISKTTNKTLKPDPSVKNQL